MSPTMPDKRSFSRVTTNVPAWLRRLPSAMAPPLFIEPGVMASEGSAAALSGGGLSENLVQFLLVLDRKLDMILSHLTRERLENDFPIRAQILDISGAGLLFHTLEPLAVGDYVEIVMLLSQIPLRQAGAIGRLTRQEPLAPGLLATPGDTSRHLMAMDFTRIRETDLDAVVQFVFQEERRQIREKKWG